MDSGKARPSGERTDVTIIVVGSVRDCVWNWWIINRYGLGRETEGEGLDYWKRLDGARDFHQDEMVEECVFS